MEKWANQPGAGAFRVGGPLAFACGGDREPDAMRGIESMSLCRSSSSSKSASSKYGSSEGFFSARGFGWEEGPGSPYWSLS